MPVPDPAPRPLRHASPPLGLVSAIYAVLFLAGLYPVTVFGGHPYFPGPWESAGTILAFFRTRPDAVRLCAALQFGAAIPLGIFSASIADRLRFLGAHVAGTSIATFGGFTAAATMSRWVSLNHALANASASSSGCSWKRFEILA